MRTETITDETGFDYAALQLEANLLADLRTKNAQSTNSNLTLTVRGPDGTLLAGLAGQTSYGWLAIKILWTREDRRGQGLGKNLTCKAEEIARKRGCHSAWLDTSNKAAVGFYAHLGYTAFAELSNAPGQQPEDHVRTFMMHRLQPCQ